MKSFVLVCAAALLAVPVSAADPPGFALWKASDLKGHDAALATHVGDDHSSRETLADYTSHRFRMLYRDADGNPEQHDAIIDIVLVQSGEGTLLLGGTMAGRRTTGPGESVGTRLDGGERHALGAGDIVHIPAGIPHSFLVPTGKHLTYVLLKIPAAAQARNPPPASDGKPDFQGIWVSKSATPLERPKSLEGRPRLSDAEVADLKARAARIFKDGKTADFPAGDNVFLAALANVDQFKTPNATGGADETIERVFENRTSLIVDPSDGKIPSLTPEGQRRQAAATAARLRPDPAGPEDLSNDRRCLTFGTPRLGGSYGAGPYSYYQLVQTPGYVVLTMEFAHEARIIPLDGRPHLSHNIRQWSGDSRGRWEGNALVVDTTNFSPKSTFFGSADNLHMVERFTRVAADQIDYEVTLDDPTTWAKPWTAVIHLTRSDEKMYEVACHEGNHYSMQGVLAGARADDKAVEEASKKRPK